MPALSPVQKATSATQAAPQSHPPRSLGLLDAVSLVVGIILGSGIFVAPAAVAALAGSQATAVGLWALGAIVAGFGALAYAECSVRLPQDGGFFVFFTQAFGWRWAYVAGWAALLLSYPISLAGVAAMGAQYLGAAWPACRGYEQVFGVLAITLAAALNAYGLALGRLAQRIISLAKVSAIFGVLAAAWWLTLQAAPAVATPLAAASPAPPTGQPHLALILQVFATIMWTYDGWTDVTMVAGEVREPGQNLPRAVLLSLTILFAIYAAVQLAVMQLLGPAAAGHPQVLAAALGQAFGARGEQILAALILLTTWGSIVGLVLATSRLTLAMAQEGAISAALAKLSGGDDLPRRAILQVWLLSSAFVWCGSFAQLLEIFSLVIWLFYGATALALLVLRRRQTGGGPEVGYGLGGKVAPFVLLVAATLMTALQVAEHGGRALFVLAVLLLARALVDPVTRLLRAK